MSLSMSVTNHQCCAVPSDRMYAYVCVCGGGGALLIEPPRVNTMDLCYVMHIER